MRALVTVIALIGAFLIVRLVTRPTYTDSYYHYNAAVRLASGEGLTDAYVWAYIGQSTPAPIVPSHLYWMPLASILAGGSMALFNAPGSYAVAQLPNILLFAGTILIAYALGGKLGGTRRHAGVAAALTLFGGFYTKFWGEIDTFAPYAFVGSLCLLALGYGLETRRLGWWALAGALAGFAHLTRSDGLLLLIVGWTVLLVDLTLRPLSDGTAPERGFRVRFIRFTIFTLAYLLVMGGWFARMMALTGAPLPVGGLQAAWFTEYNDLFRYPQDASAAEFFAGGIGRLIETRSEALGANFGTLIAVEGFVVLMPLMLIGLWRKRGRFILPMALFALGLHAAMTLIFPYPGMRGGLLHGAAALLPWWAAFSGVGLDAAVAWIAKRRRRWQPKAAIRFFSGAVVALAMVLTFANIRGAVSGTPEFYTRLAQVLPDEARVLINDPAALYHYTGLGGAVLPNEQPEVIAEIAQEYGITHVVIENITERDGQTFSTSTPAPLQRLLTSPPEFLREIESGLPDVRLYEIVLR